MNHVPIITAKQCQKIYGKKISLDGFSFFLSEKYHAFTKSGPTYLLRVIIFVQAQYTKLLPFVY